MSPLKHTHSHKHFSGTALKLNEVLFALWAEACCLITLRVREALRRQSEAALCVSSAAFNWNGTKNKIEVVQQTDFNPFSVSQFRHFFLFPLIGWS